MTSADAETSKYILIGLAASLPTIAVIYLFLNKKTPERTSALQEKADDILRSIRGRDERELQNRISELGESIKGLKEKISQYETDPPRVLIEKIYLKANGWANTGLLLCISFIVFESSKLSPQIEKFLREIKPANKEEKIDKIIDLLADEGRAVSYTLVAYLIFTALLLTISMEAKGRSVEIINRSFAICLVIALATFGIFYVWRSGSIS